MRAVLDFNLPDDKEEFERALKGSAWYYVVRELDDILRSRIKYEELPKEQRETLQAVRDTISELILRENLTWE